MNEFNLFYTGSTTKTNLNFIAFPPPLKESLLPQAPVIVQALDQAFDAYVFIKCFKL